MIDTRNETISVAKLDFLAVPITDLWKCLALPNCTVSRSIVVTQQLQRKWYRRQRADGDQRPANRSPLLTAQLFRKQQRDAGAQHCTRARDETDLRNGDFVLFHLWFDSLIVMLIHHRWARAASRALPLPAPEARLAFPPHAQRNAFRRD